MLSFKLGCGIIIFFLSGCAAQEGVNNLIADSNSRRYEAFTKGMVSAQTEGARIAIAMGFAGGLGQQTFFRERDGVDYLNGFLPYFSFAVPFLAGGYREGEQSMAAGRDIYFNSTNTRNTTSSALQDYFVNGSGHSLISNDNLEEATGQ